MMDAIQGGNKKIKVFWFGFAWGSRPYRKIFLVYVWVEMDDVNGR